MWAIRIRLNATGAAFAGEIDHQHIGHLLHQALAGKGVDHIRIVPVGSALEAIVFVLADTPLEAEQVVCEEMARLIATDSELSGLVLMSCQLDFGLHIEFSDGETDERSGK